MTLELKDISFSRNETCLFSNINYTVHPGQMLQIMGANGCGKSTLLRIITGFLTPKTGEILWQKKSILKQNFHQNLHYVGHHNALKPHLTLYDNIQLFCSLKCYKIKPNQLNQITDQLMVQHLLPIKLAELSAGQLRRASLIKLLIYPAKLWILDEPLTALDKTGQEIILALFKTHLADTGMIIAATHQLLSTESSSLFLNLC